MINNKKKLIGAQEWSDYEVIQRILGGERQLLEILYDRYSTRVFHKCLSITKDRVISQDLSHDVMIKVFLNIHKFKATSDFSFWVNSITFNHCIDFLKKKKRLSFKEFEAETYSQISSNEIELENKILKELQLDQLEVLFENLKADERMILLMRYQDCISVKNIASILDVSESAVKMRLKRSRDKLATLLKKTTNE